MKGLGSSSIRAAGADVPLSMELSQQHSLHDGGMAAMNDQVGLCLIQGLI